MTVSDIGVATLVRAPRQCDRGHGGGSGQVLEAAPTPGGTVVRLRGHGYPDTPEGIEQFVSCATGGARRWLCLEVYVEHGIPPLASRNAVTAKGSSAQCLPSSGQILEVVGFVGGR